MPSPAAQVLSDHSCVKSKESGWPFFGRKNSRTAEWIKTIISTFEYIRVVVVRLLVCDGWLSPASAVHYLLGAFLRGGSALDPHSWR